MKKRNILILTLMATFGLTACGEATKRTLGLERSKPDEFAVYRRAPLTLPPDYQLSPPKPGAPRPQEAQMSEQARSLLVTTPETPSSLSQNSPSEQGFLSRINSQQANPQIRDILVDEHGLESRDPSTPKTAVQKLFGLGDNQEDVGTPIDPKQESDKLQDKGINTPRPVPLQKDPDAQ